MPVPASKLTISVTARHTQPGHTIQFIVLDSGKTPLTVKVLATDAIRIGGKCGVANKPVGWVTVTHPVLSLAPSQQAVDPIVIHSTGATGAHDLALIAAPESATGKGVHVIGAAATQTTVTFPGKNPAATPCEAATAKKAAPVTPAPSIVPTIGVIVAAVLLLALLVYGVLRLKRRFGIVRK